jgi:hypothetical protein
MRPISRDCWAALHSNELKYWINPGVNQRRIPRYAVYYTADRLHIDTSDGSPITTQRRCNQKVNSDRVHICGYTRPVVPTDCMLRRGLARSSGATNSVEAWCLAIIGARPAADDTLWRGRCAA